MAGTKLLEARWRCVIEAAYRSHIWFPVRMHKLLSVETDAFKGRNILANFQTRFLRSFEKF